MGSPYVFLTNFEQNIDHSRRVVGLMLLQIAIQSENPRRLPRGKSVARTSESSRSYLICLWKYLPKCVFPTLRLCRNILRGLFQVCFHLKPLDLLQLARSTRSLNQILMSRKSRLIWRAARNSVKDLPDCPPDLSEPEYARFIFEQCCQVSNYIFILMFY